MPPQPSPENLVLMRYFGAFMLLTLVPALWLRATYFRGVIRRDEEPREYWSAVACQGVLGLFCFVGALLRSVG